MSKVGIPPPHNSDKPHAPVAGNYHNIPYYYHMQQYYSVNCHTYMVSSQLLPEVLMLVRIYEFQLHYKIIYFDIDITIKYILL